MKEETAHHIVCECSAIKSIRVGLYGKPLFLPEEVMENSPVCFRDWAAKLGNRGGTMGQA